MTASAALVETDLTCVGCDYNLRTQLLDGACPECGKPVQTTLKFHTWRAARRGG